MQAQTNYVPHKTPNILVTGTPGTGKTTFCHLLNQSVNFQYLPIGQLIKENKLYDQWDDQLDVPIFDQDRLQTFLQNNYNISNGGLIVDFHSPTVFPSQWFDLIIIMRCNNQILYKRLEERKYPQNKIAQNIECQIMHQVKFDIQECFGDRPQCILELTNEVQGDMEKCIETAFNWLLKYKHNVSQN